MALTNIWLARLLAVTGAPALVPPLARALHHVLVSRGNAPIEHVVADWISPRQLRRLFARHIGLAPKGSRIVRFQAALGSHSVSRAADWAAASYFDPLHLQREFRQLHGQAPRTS